MEFKEQASKPKFNKSSFSKPIETDLFETPPEMTKVLDFLIPELQGKKIFEPANGYGAITNYLRSHGLEVLARDKYYMEESHDFLTEPIPDDIDMVIT